MAIDDATFAAWARSDAPKVLLCEMKFAYESAGAPAEGTLYLSTERYVTSPTDAPANQPYRDVISQPAKVKRSINADSIGGQTQVSVSTMKLDNADGALDFMLQLIVDGRQVTYFLGAPEGTPGWTRADFRTVQVTVAEYITAPDEKSIEVTLRDQRLLLDKAIAGDVVNDNRLKPILLASGGPAGCCSVEPVQKDAVALTYYVAQNFGTCAGGQPSGNVVNAYDNGLSIFPAPLFQGTNAAITANATTDTITFASHGLASNDVVSATNILGGGIFAGLVDGKQYWVIASGLTANDFKLSATKGGTPVDITGTVFTGQLLFSRGRVYTDSATVDGTIQLSSAAAGRLTVDAAGLPLSYAGGVFDSSTGETLRALIVEYGGVPSAQVDATSFRNADSSMPLGNYEGFARAVLTRENLLTVLDEIAQTTQIFYGPDALGVFRAGRLDLSALAGAVSVNSIDANGVFSDIKVENARVITGTIAILCQKNNTPLSYGELAGSVTVDAKRALSAADRVAAQSTAPSGTSYSSNWQGFYKTAVRTELSGSFDPEAPGGLADEILGDIKPIIQTIDLPTDLRAYAWNLGDVVTLTYPRYGFGAGQKCKVIAIEPDFLAERVNVTLITKTAPDTTNATH